MPDRPTDLAGAAPPRAYHHGNLRLALIAAAVEIVAEAGAEALTIREAARRAGVSSGAPFRHFNSKIDLLTAVAEEGMAKLKEAIGTALASCGATDPLVRLRALGDAYLDWAIAHPTHYRVLGDRTTIDFYRSAALVRDNAWIRAETIALMQRAAADGLLRSPDVDTLHLQVRAMAYGLTRMYVDGHFPEFSLAEDTARSAMRATLHDFLASLATAPMAPD